MPLDENGHANALREAVNVDLATDGTASRRDGYSPVRGGVLCHSLWAPPGAGYGLYVDQGELQVLYPGGVSEPVGCTVGDLPLSYAVAGDNVIFSNRAVCGLLTPGLAAHPWAPEQPAGQPVAAAFAGGALPAGQYQVAVTFTDAIGRESGTTLAEAVFVPASGGISLVNIPQPLTAVSIGVYLSDANDTALRRYATLPASTAALTITSPAQGRRLQTQRLAPLPPGQWLAVHGGRQWVASGRHLYWSPALRYGMTDRARQVIVFGDDIDLLLPVGNGGAGSGLYVAAGPRTYFLDGANPESDDFSQRIVSGVGATPGSATVLGGDILGLPTPDPVATWLARDGRLCVGAPGGSVTRLHEGMYVIDAASRAATMLRERNGAKQLVLALRGARKQSLAVTDKAVAHVIHSGT